MRVSCPACQAELSLDMLLASEEARAAVARLAAVSLPFGALVLRYLALFRPARRRLSIERLVSLLAELLPDIERGAIARKGRDWPAPHATWQAALDAVLAARDKGTLTTPLASHAYLYEVIAGLADKAEALAEREREQGRRHKPVDVNVRLPADAFVHPLAALAPAPAVPIPAPITGPSPAARRIQEAIAASKARKGAATAPEGDPA